MRNLIAVRASLAIAVSMVGLPAQGAEVLQVRLITNQPTLGLRALELTSSNYFPFTRQAESQLFNLKKSDIQDHFSGSDVSPFLDLSLEVTAATGETVEQLAVRLPLALSSLHASSLRMYVTEPEVSFVSIQEFVKRGLGGDQAVRTLFEARKVYRTALSRNRSHPLLVPAAYWYFVAAYEVARRQGSVIVFDHDAIVQSEFVLSSAAKDKQMKEGLKWVDVRHWRAMLAKARRLDWADARLIEAAAVDRDWVAASQFNEYYHERYKDLPDAERAAVRLEYGLTESLFVENASWFAAVSVDVP